MGMTPAGWAKTSPGDKFRIVQSLITHNEQAIRFNKGKDIEGQVYAQEAIEWAKGRELAKDHPVYDIGQAYIKAIEDTDDLVVNAGKGLNPDGTPGKITVNENTVIHEGPGHHNQDLAKANKGGSRTVHEPEVNDIEDVFNNLEGNRKGKGALQVRPEAGKFKGYADYRSMKGEVGARKTADNALSGNRTIDNLAEPKSAVDYRIPQTIGKDGKWVNETSRNPKTREDWGLLEATAITNNPSRISQNFQGKVDKVLKYLKFTEEMGINNPKTLDNWLAQEQKSLMATVKRKNYINDLNLPESSGLLDSKSKSLWDYPDQKITSAGTSINSTKPAEAFTKLLKKDAFKKGSTNFDIGGGKFDNVNDLLTEKAGATNVVYDPFNRTKAHNAEVVKKMAGGKSDTVTVNNTLNVIEDTPNQIRVLEQAKDAVKKDGKVYISVYEGDRTGKGRPTSKGWQRHQKVEDYLETVKQVFPNARIENKIIVIDN